MITRISTRDARFPIGSGHGSDAIHKDPIYSYAVTLLTDDKGRTGTGLAFTLGEGNDLVCRAAEFYASRLKGRDIEEIMADFGALQKEMADEQQFRWLGPHKGIVQLALASVTNACWDLWAKTRGVPLWQLLLDLSSASLLATLDFSYVEDVLSKEAAAEILENARATRQSRTGILAAGYPGYDTSIGWFNYSDEQVAANVARSVATGFTAMKLKVGSPDMARDERRARLVRDAAGPEARIMVDANQQWTVPQAIEFARRTADLNLFWFEEPTHPDDVLGHARIAQTVAPLKIAAGEHVPNRIVFKNYLESGALAFCQVDALRVAGVSEFLVVSLMARKYGIPVVPHVGDMGQLHQHLVLFNHIALDHEALLLEHIPHLRQHFTQPCRVEAGVYRTPHEAGASCDLR
ncbi:MAG: mandelate racemase [Verrucomicrobiaceae bacterium]|nr:MAG: mandelate racemase [Verrucomicrobiaceae bacterium]